MPLWYSVFYKVYSSVEKYLSLLKNSLKRWLGKILNIFSDKFRVSKVGGEIFIISHGQPVHRRELFVATLGAEKYKYMFSKQRKNNLLRINF